MEHFYQNIEGWAQPHEQGELFNTIVDNPSGKLKIAEIGVYHGRGTALICVDLINKGVDFEYHAIDHFEGSPEHVKGIDYETITRNNLIPLKDLITIHKNNSVSQSSLYEDEYFDIVYIDGAHDYDSVKNDIQSWLPKVKPGGFICGDDYCTSWPGVYEAVNEMFGEDNINAIGNQQQWWIKK
jgi:predicted O-methyltransferase YrrM